MGMFIGFVLQVAAAVIGIGFIGMEIYEYIPMALIISLGALMQSSSFSIDRREDKRGNP